MYYFNTDKILKVKYMGKNVNLCAKVAINTWANCSESNTWENRMPIYGQQHSNIWAESNTWAN